MTAPVEYRVPIAVLRAQRDPLLRRHHAAAVFAEVWGVLNDTDPRPVKVRETARSLRLNVRTMRYALDLLEQHGYLCFTHRDGRGIRHFVRAMGSNGVPTGPR